MRKTDSVTATALCNLLGVGQVLKKFYKAPAELILDWHSTSLLNYMYCMGFFTLVDDFHLFAYDDGAVGGFAPRPPGKFRMLRCFSEAWELETADQLIAKDLSQGMDVDLAADLGECIVELVRNSMTHGRSPCFVSAIGDDEFGTQCAVTDVGVGFLATLRRKLPDLRLFQAEQMRKNDGREHLRAILEAVYRRVGSKTYGVSSVVRDLTSMGGVVRIHSHDTQVVFTRANYQRFAGRTDSRQQVVDELFRYLNLRKELAPDPLRSPLRVWDASFTGVHVEFEIPSSATRGAHR